MDVTLGLRALAVDWVGGLNRIPLHDGECGGWNL